MHRKIRRESGHLLCAFHAALTAFWLASVHPGRIFSLWLMLVFGLKCFVDAWMRARCKALYAVIRSLLSLKFAATNSFSISLFYSSHFFSINRQCGIGREWISGVSSKDISTGKWSLPQSFGPKSIVAVPSRSGDTKVRSSVEKLSL